MFSFNFVTKDELLGKRIRSYRFGCRCLVTAEPLRSPEVALYVLAIEEWDLWRERCDKLPLIFYGRAEHLSCAFALGARDYLREPWTDAELECRVMKASPRDRLLYPFGALTFYGERIISPLGEECRLTPYEHLLFRQLVVNRGEVVPRENLEYAICREGRKSRSVDVHLAKIRKKLQRLLPQGEEQKLIISIRGQGYMMI